MDSGCAQGVAERGHQADRQSLPSAGVPGQDRSDPRSRACSQPSSAQDHLHLFQVRLHLPFLGHRESQKLHLPPWAHCPVRETEVGGGATPVKETLEERGARTSGPSPCWGCSWGCSWQHGVDCGRLCSDDQNSLPTVTWGQAITDKGVRGGGLWRCGQHSSQLRAGPLPSFQQASHQEIHAGVTKSAFVRKPENAPPLQRIYILVQIQIP